MNVLFVCECSPFFYSLLDILHTDIGFISRTQICDGRRDNDIRNRRRDVEEDENPQFTVGLSFVFFSFHKSKNKLEYLAYISVCIVSQFLYGS